MARTPYCKFTKKCPRDHTHPHFIGNILETHKIWLGDHTQLTGNSQKWLGGWKFIELGRE
jgi:hypothetical protein